jgi:hypothetical protein
LFVAAAPAYSAPASTRSSESSTFGNPLWQRKFPDKIRKIEITAVQSPEEITLSFAGRATRRAE